MDGLIEFVKEFTIPGSVTFLMIGLTVGVVLLHARGRWPRWGKIWLTSLAASYWILSTSACAGTLEGLLSYGAHSIVEPEEARGADAIVILGGGSVSFRSKGREINVLSDASSLRVLEGARLYEMLDRPWVIVSGGMDERAGKLTAESEPMREALIEAGVSPDRILTESQSANTFEQAANLKPLFQAHEIERFVLVTSPTHMRRAEAIFRSQGYDFIPSASAQHSEPRPARPSEAPPPKPRPPFLPSDDAMAYSRAALREAMALIFYQARGWLSSP